MSSIILLLMLPNVPNPDHVELLEVWQSDLTGERFVIAWDYYPRTDAIHVRGWQRDSDPQIHNRPSVDYPKTYLWENGTVVRARRAVWTQSITDPEREDARVFPQELRRAIGR